MLSYYTIKVFINPLDMKHGQDLFDKRYYRRFFKDYSESELLLYYRWSLGWIRFLDKYLPLKDGSGKSALRKGGVIVISTPFPTKRSLADATHINVHAPKYWTDLAKKLGFKKGRILFASFTPFLFRLTGPFCLGFSIKTD